ncbi:hypothetical protein O3M35_009942 [Rhynocoris fuscipes]|uniref:Uncharacterized protein n=1 Tax=Rhynocoris fuscipes TaxID=488301 RepID=A0AAW1CY52_9HEMI
MLPANLAKTRAAGRGAYGELVLTGAGRGAGTTGTVRYAPYPVPVFPAGPTLYHHHPAAAAALPKRFLIRPQPPPLAAYAMTELLPIPTALDLTTVFPTLPQAIAL